MAIDKLLNEGRRKKEEVYKMWIQTRPVCGESFQEQAAASTQNG
jgi:hypothetical protein